MAMTIEQLAEALGGLTDRKIAALAEVLITDHPLRAQQLESALRIEQQDRYYQLNPQEIDTGEGWLYNTHS